MIGSSTWVCVEWELGRRVAGRSLKLMGKATEPHSEIMIQWETLPQKWGRCKRKASKVFLASTCCAPAPKSVYISHNTTQHNTSHTHAHMHSHMCTHSRNMFSKSNKICMVNCCHVRIEHTGKALIEFKHVMFEELFWNSERLMKEFKLHYDQV